ncbi:MAG TPA: sterol desaturase family protein [Pseudolabrys sp.]|nr:sterol desaturase family protein [Pseudolabrys sp.]
MHLIDFKAILIVALIFIPLERMLPLHPDQRVFRRHWQNDLVYLFLNGVAIHLGLLAIIAAAMAAIEVIVPDAVGKTVRLQPIWLQAIEVVVIADTGFYIAHRLFHAVPFLWRFHVIHHSIEEMDWLAAHRVHPVDQVLTKTASLLPLFVLGFSDAAILIFAFIYQWQSVLIHSNTRIGLGPLKWIVASPEFHHWHHANERDALNKNFAGQFSFIDALGGTLFMPTSRSPEKYGTDEPVPTLYHQQMAFPLAQAREDGRTDSRLVENVERRPV